MPRTPLLRSIVRFLRKIKYADKFGISVEALEDSEASAKNQPLHSGVTLSQQSRRQFLVGATTAAAGLAFVRPARGFVERALSPRIAIIGAGISGLSCALALADKGIASTVYEASARVGGRIFSNNTGYWSDNQVTEWCGELIDSNHVTIRALANRFGLPLENVHDAEPVGSTDTYFFNGTYYPRADSVADFQAVYAAVQTDAANTDDVLTGELTAKGKALDRTSIARWIHSRVPGGLGSRMGKLLDAAYATEFGADTRDQSALNLVYELSASDTNFELYGTSDEVLHILGGNDQLTSAMSNSLAAMGTPIQVGMRMESLRKLPDGTYRIGFDLSGSTQEVNADLVVLTLPFAVLRSLDYRHAEFDALKKKAISALGRGRNGKLQLQFNRRLWNETGSWGMSTGTTFSDTGYQNSWEPTRGQPGISGILNDYSGGASAIRRMKTQQAFADISDAGVQQDATVFLDRIERVFPGIKPLWNAKATCSLPHLSPNFNCSYSYYRVGQINAFGDTERDRQSNVFFAGEHTSIDFQGFMEGAAAEGQRAAGEILTQLGVV